MIIEDMVVRPPIQTAEPETCVSVDGYQITTHEDGVYSTVESPEGFGPTLEK